jgi:hypothetical protein
LTTPLDIIIDALEKLNVYAPGETPTDADGSRGFQLLHDLVDQWADDSIQLFQITPIAVFLQGGTQTYTLGQGGTVLGSWAQRVLIGPNVGSVIIGGVTTPLSSVSAIEWNAIYNTLQPSTPPTGIPVAVYYDPQFPLGLLNFSPVPSDDGMAFIGGYYGLTNFPTALTLPDVTLAPGQQLGLTANLALMFHSYFQVGQITPDLVAQAQQAKTTLTLTNRLSRAMSARNVAPQTPIAPRP